MHYRVVATILLLAAKSANAHSFVEQLTNIASDGSYVSCFGYPRAFVDKSADAKFDQEANKWLLPPAGGPPFINETHLLCHPSQQVPNQAGSFSRLQTRPGSMIALRYAENGHVTMPGGGLNLVGKPKKGGTVFVFGTKQPRPGETLQNVMHWTRDGKGGDQSGRLLTAQNFDDDRCYQLSDDSIVLGKARRLQTPNPIPGQPGSDHELFCETNVRLPGDITVGQPYTLYWVWQWPTAPQQEREPLHGKDEYYTSCIDVDVVVDLPLDQCGAGLKDQDPMTAAVPNFKSRTALTIDPLALSSQADFGPPTMTRDESFNIQQTATAVHHRRLPN
ncbi:hypothetical protein PSV08DRAFT_355243 [Bipolaris maydis]|nr:hypothetical protein PSV08DRAFT_186697 [Bipolaris maydis]KAJ6267693.1 hypothetical protein PSV08DRAFT_355243 [Bipolaris maydis]